MQFNMTAERISTLTVTVDAENEEDARRKAMEDEDIIWDDDDSFTDIWKIIEVEVIE